LEVIELSFVDKTLNCADCGADFVFTTGEQEFHASKGFTHEPRRCPTCRSARRGQRDGGYSSGGGSYGGERQMFSATCSSCGKEATVPFEPRCDKPVYCSDCFRSRQDSSSYGGASRGGGNRW
jgi:CxxC-x17-CxxC domain-containing protein